MPSKKNEEETQPLCACGSAMQYGAPCPDCKNINTEDGGVWIPKVNNIVTLHLPATQYAELLDLINWRFRFVGSERDDNLKRLWAVIVRQGGSTPVPAYDRGEKDPVPEPVKATGPTEVKKPWYKRLFLF